MNFRLEEKISINNFNVFDFKKWLFSKGAKILYPSRIINSIYFDNNLKMYSDSNEGTVPRKKIRIREYPEFKNKLFIEKKISSVEGRFKTSNKLTALTVRAIKVRPNKITKKVLKISFIKFK